MDLTKTSTIFRSKIAQLSSDWVDVQPAKLGDENEVVITGKPGIYYVRLFTGETIEVGNQAHVSPKHDLDVFIGRSKNRPGMPQIICEREVYRSPADGDQFENHHEQHEEGGRDRLNLDRKQIIQLSVRVSDAANFCVRVYGAIVKTATGTRKIRSQDFDVSSYVVTTGAKYVAIECDDEGALTLHEGTTFDSIQISIASNLPEPDPGKYTLAWIAFYDGQTSLLDSDIVSPMPLPGMASGGVVDSVNGQTGDVVLDPDDLDDASTTHKFTTAGDISKLAGIEARATKYPDTGEEIYSSAEKTKLSGIETSADVTDIGNVGSSLHGASEDTVADADEFSFWQIANSIIKKITWTNIKTTLKTYFDTLYASITNTRVQLTADRDYYVRTDGNDSNNGLSNTAGGAFLTIQKAVDTAAALDANGKVITIHVADGTYTGAVQLKSVVGSAGISDLIIVGNEGTPANVVISTTSASCFSDASHTIWNIRGMKLQTATSGSCLLVTSGGTIRFQNINFGACASAHMNLDGVGSKVESTGNYTISGNAYAHYYNSNLSYILVSNITVTISANLAFSYFSVCGQIAAQRVYGNTYSLGAYAVTGTRYLVNANAVIFTNGGGASYFPGNGAGSSATGGQYV